MRHAPADRHGDLEHGTVLATGPNFCDAPDLERRETLRYWSDGQYVVHTQDRNLDDNGQVIQQGYSNGDYFTDYSAAVAHWIKRTSNRPTT